MASSCESNPLNCKKYHKPCPGECGNHVYRYSAECRACRNQNIARFWQDPSNDAERPPTPEEVAWTAGLFEGEGSVRYHSGSFSLSIPQLDPEFLHRLPAFFGGTISGPHKPIGMHTWMVCGFRGLAVAETIYPWLSSRRQAQIDHARSQCPAYDVVLSAQEAS